MKTLLALLFAVAVFGLTPNTAHCDTTDQMVTKVVGVNKSNGGFDPVATAAQALVDKDNTILLKTYTGRIAFDPSKVTLPVGTLAVQSVATLTSSATISFAPGVVSSVFKLTPAHTATINAVITNAVAGRSYNLVITTSGTSSYTLTFGTAFKTTATLATGTTSAKVFVITFVFDGTNFNEVSRTTAM